MIRLKLSNLIRIWARLVFHPWLRILALSGSFCSCKWALLWIECSQICIFWRCFYCDLLTNFFLRFSFLSHFLHLDEVWPGHNSQTVHLLNTLYIGISLKPLGFSGYLFMWEWFEPQLLKSWDWFSPEKFRIT